MNQEKIIRILNFSVKNNPVMDIFESKLLTTNYNLNCT